MKHIITYTQKELDDELLKFSEKEASLQKVRELIKDGANVNCHDSMRNNTPLIIASQRLNYSIIKLLIENGADVNLSNKNNNNCLYYIINQNTYNYNKYKNRINSIIDLIITSGINLNNENKSNLDIFNDIQKSNPFMIQYIIDNYPDKYKEYTMKKTANKFNI